MHNLPWSVPSACLCASFLNICSGQESLCKPAASSALPCSGKGMDVDDVPDAENEAARLLRGDYETPQR